VAIFFEKSFSISGFCALLWEIFQQPISTNGRESFRQNDLGQNDFPFTFLPFCVP
jgi:hypothetical protein